MVGAIIGDIVGSIYEFDNKKTKDVELFAQGCKFTDDSLMTLAVAKALLDCNGDYINLDQLTIQSMKDLAKQYGNVGFGDMFKAWLEQENPQPYQSIGNGSAMRISPVAYVARDLDELKALVYKVTSITHNTEEAIKGAEAVASCIFLARKGYSKSEIEKFVETHYYKLDYDLETLQKHYKFTPLCGKTVPPAIFCFMQGNSFEDVLRTAISIGGDSDTIACIAGSIAEAFFPVLNQTKEKALSYLPEGLQNIYKEFADKFIQ
jgi:type I restriction enzyme M protein